jgi:hypothetical protein
MGPMLMMRASTKAEAFLLIRLSAATVLVLAA